MKILYITTIGGTMSFFKSLISELIKEGNTIDIATNEETSKVPDCYREWGCNIYPISTSRSPFCFGNVKAIKQIGNIAKDYDIVHCHTPLAGMATRLGCRKLRKKQGLKVVYTAHGFHFYKGAPKKNWMIYYPIEKICSKWTDVLITINKEDYLFAKKKMKAKQIKYIPGVGIDTKKFANTVVNVDKKREELGILKDAYLILSVGELNKNKNHQIVIKAIHEVQDSNIYYIIAGEGDKGEELEKLAKKLNVNLKLLGFRKDVAELYKTANLYILPSIREGLNVSCMEAISCGCPTIVSRIRGNVDMVPTTNCFNPFNEKEIAELIKKRIAYSSNDFVNQIDYMIINKEMKTILESCNE